MEAKTPTPADACTIVGEVLGCASAAIERFPTGLCHHVYEIRTEDGQAVVVRIATPECRGLLAGAVHFSSLLRPLGVPLPELIAADLDGRLVPFPYIVLERLPGTDLGHVYSTLSAGEKRTLARRLGDLQSAVGTLPEGQGFGCTTHIAGPFPHRTPLDALRASLRRTRAWMQRAGVVDPGLVDRVERAADQFADYFATLRPRPYLDDITTKNVLVYDGRLSGIVDVDELGFGDPLTTLALTRMALLASGHETDYIDYWCEAISITPLQRRVLDFYTAESCACFLGEVGQAFNKPAPPPIDRAYVGRLQDLLDHLLACAAG